MDYVELSKEISRIYNDYSGLSLSDCINLGLLINSKDIDYSKLVELGFMDFDGVIIKCTMCGNKTDVTSNEHYSSCDKCNKVFENNKGE